MTVLAVGADRRGVPRAARLEQCLLLADLQVDGGAVVALVGVAPPAAADLHVAVCCALGEHVRGAACAETGLADAA